jgi:S1-C subfamily serine protease
MNGMIQTISFDHSVDANLLDVYSKTISSVAQSAGDAVVHIVAQKEIVNPRTRRKEQQPGIGTGFIISSDGYLVTNNHVVEGASQIKILLSNGIESIAILRGTDPSTDIAVLKIHEHGLKSLQTANYYSRDKLRLRSETRWDFSLP